MKTIESLMAEYKIRFHDTDEILKSPPNLGVDIETLNKGEYTPSVNGRTIYNRNGCVYENGKWATAKLTKKPEKWVVEKDENHPMWEKFKKWWIGQDDARGTRALTISTYNIFLSDLYKQYIDLIKAARWECQYITLDQWAEFYLPKVDFSIHNDCEFFFVKTRHYKSWLSRGKLTEGNCTSFCLNNNILDTTGRLVSSKDEIIEFRRPTEEEFNTLYQHHPKYLPLKKGVYGMCWDGYSTRKFIDQFERMDIGEDGECYYITTGNTYWTYFTPFSPELQKLLNEEVSKIENKIK